MQRISSQIEYRRRPYRGGFMDIEGILAIIFVLGVPSLALATHLVLRPLVRDIANAIRSGHEADREELERRVVRLEEAIRNHDRDLDRLREVERFHRELESRG